MKFNTNNPIAANSWLFGKNPEQLLLKNFVLMNCLEGVQDPAELTKGPFAVFTILVLLHNVIRLKHYYDSSNPCVIILSGRMEFCFKARVFHVSELRSRTEKLLQPKDDSQSVGVRKWQLLFTNVGEEDTMNELVNKIFEGKPTWGEPIVFGENIVNERDVIDPCTPCIPDKILCRVVLSKLATPHLEFYKIVNLVHQYLQSSSSDSSTQVRKCDNGIFFIPKRHSFSRLVGGASHISSLQVDEIVRSHITLLRQSLRYL